MISMILVPLSVGLTLLGSVQDDVTSFSGKTPESAKVNGWLIRQQRVERFVAQKLAGRTVNQIAMQRLNSEALEHLVRRQVIIEYLKTTRFWPRGGTVEMRVSQFGKRLEQVDKNLRQHLLENGLTRAELENEIGWEVAWKQFLQDWLSEERLDEFYQRRHREFDGTRIKVAHLVLRAKEGEGLVDVFQRAESIRDQVRLGQSTWDAAVGKHSLADSSRQEDGLLGWIGFDGPMSPEFSQAAFQLDPGQISPPVATSAGVHLIKCLEIDAGSAGRKDIEPALRAVLTEEMFHRLAEQQRSEFDIQYDPAGG